MTYWRPSRYYPDTNGHNPGVRDNSDTNNGADKDDQDTTNNTSTTALFAGHGRDEGAGNYSSDSDGSSTGRAARHGRVVMRPESVILRGDSYVALTDFRSRGIPWVASTNHICQICKDGSRCWCPARHRCQRHRRGSRKQRLSRCTSCGKVYVIYGASRQWCCQNWIPEPSGSPSPTR